MLCCLWNCICCLPGDERSRRRRLAAQAAEAEAAIFRASLGFEEGIQRVPHGLSVGDRRQRAPDENVIAAKDIDEEASWAMQRSKSDLLISSSRHVVISPTNKEPDQQDAATKAACPICLTDYVDGDEICWSHNERCNHVFHRECIVEWLTHHDECPCCRLNFLSLHDDAEGQDDDLPIDQSSSISTVGDDEEESLTHIPAPSRGGLSLFRPFGSNRSHGPQRQQEENEIVANDPPEVSRVGTSETDADDDLDNYHAAEEETNVEKERPILVVESQTQDDQSSSSEISAFAETLSNGDESK
eukprot:CAMPEP_0194066606 /NCGR_PEP_ID=MMETSP0009_2-20130614/86116_1 /TAXON_ID=210454 /ORGANISM="Grammatophora oceanica, Strain CCMP 410" /LENGTH=300 /DNA_ID=CAMNT_0038719577 /DNA_START=233 /DNA_END=1136 /DNA_ORIENTATION=-